MDFDTIVVAGILGFGVVNALALAGVLAMTRPGRRRRGGMSVWEGQWEGQSAPKPFAATGQPDPAESAA